MDWLSEHGSFQDLSLQASRLAELQALLDRSAPVKGLVVRTLEQTVLSVSAPNASIAAKFRQFEPSVLKTLTERGWKVSRIRVRPQLGDMASDAPSTTPPKPPVPPQALAAMRTLYEGVESGPLKIAIAHFLASRRR